jgi:hypothetical protein
MKSLWDELNKKHEELKKESRNRAGISATKLGVLLPQLFDSAAFDNEYLQRIEKNRDIVPDSFTNSQYKVKEDELIDWIQKFSFENQKLFLTKEKTVVGALKRWNNENKNYFLELVRKILNKELTAGERKFFDQLERAVRASVDKKIA